MKRLFFRSFFATIILSVFFFSSCEVGMGESVDLEAPVIEITWPANNGYCNPSFYLEGTASDNRGLSDIEITYSYRKRPDGELIPATRHTNTDNRRNGTWRCLIELPDNFGQEITITAYARDARGNEEIESQDSVVVLVDLEAPSHESILITRNTGDTTNPAQISKFLGEDGRTEKRNKDSGLKDFFQNESITLSTNITENYEIERTYLNLYEISDYKSVDSYKKTIIKKEIPKESSSTNPFNPEFKITQEMLTGWNSSLRTGVHYIMPEIIAVDKAHHESKPVNPNQEPLVFAWEAEYDKPKVVLPLYYDEKAKLLKFQESTKVPVIIFDDDGLFSYEWKLTNGTITKTGYENLSTENLREFNFEIDTEYYDAGKTQKITDGDYKLTITVTDKITGIGGGGKNRNKRRI